MKKLIILLTLLAACTQDEPKDFQLAVSASVEKSNVNWRHALIQ